MQGPWTEYKAWTDSGSSDSPGGHYFKPKYRWGKFPWFVYATGIFLFLSMCRGLGG